MAGTWYVPLRSWMETADAAVATPARFERASFSAAPSVASGFASVPSPVASLPIGAIMMVIAAAAALEVRTGEWAG